MKKTIKKLVAILSVMTLVLFPVMYHTTYATCFSAAPTIYSNDFPIPTVNNDF